MFNQGSSRKNRRNHLISALLSGALAFSSIMSATGTAVLAQEQNFAGEDSFEDFSDSSSVESFETEETDSETPIQAESQQEGEAGLKSLAPVREELLVHGDDDGRQIRRENETESFDHESDLSADIEIETGSAKLASLVKLTDDLTTDFYKGPDGQNLYFYENSTFKKVRPDKTVETIYDFPYFNRERIRTCGNRLAIVRSNASFSGYEEGASVVFYDMANDREEKRIVLENAPGWIKDALIDESGRIFILDTSAQTKLYLYDSNGKLLSQTTVEGNVDQLDCYSETHSFLFFDTIENYRSWGYDHDMHFIGGVKLNGNTFGQSKDVLCDENRAAIMTGQVYFSERSSYCQVIGDVLIADCPTSAAIMLFDIRNAVNSLKLGDDGIASIDRNNHATDDLESGIGPRLLPVPGKSSFIAYLDPNTIGQISSVDGSIQAELHTEGPVRSVLPSSKGVTLVIRKDDGLYRQEAEYCAQNISFGSSKMELNAGETKTLALTANTAWERKLTWNSSDPKVASISPDGVLYGVVAGTCTITVTDSFGNKASIQVQVKGSAPLIGKRSQAILPGTLQNQLSGSLMYQGTYGSVIPVSLVETKDGMMQVDAKNGILYIQYYDRNGKLLSSKQVKQALPLFGGFLAYGNDYFVITGQENPNDKDDQPVLCAERYSTDWKLQKKTVLKGMNTSYPFEAGSCSMDVAKGLLTVHTCHQMYRSDDGLKHQANMTFVFNVSDMSLKDSYTDVMNIAQAGYVSHSFNQFVRSDETHLYRVDHGDGFPRGLSIVKTPIGGDITRVEYVIPFSIYGEIGYNYTGVSVGGFELSDSTCLIAGRSIDQKTFDEPTNIFLTVTSKDLNTSKTVMVTNYAKKDDLKLGTPRIVKITTTAFLVMWEEEKGNSRTTKITAVDANGNRIANDITETMPLSVCQPVLFSDKTVRWLSGDTGKPILCSISLNTKSEASKPVGGSPSTGNPSPGNPSTGTPGSSTTIEPMYRLYNPNSGEHFYTAAAAEKNMLVSVGWTYEGIGWNAPKSTGSPVYRLYNANAGDHHYTMSAQERDALIKFGWKYEGIGWKSAGKDGVPLYRQYNPNAQAGSHNYTTNKKENDHLVTLGWKAEGIGWYGVASR